MENTATAEQIPVVNAFNEWDHLEEVIVGIVDYATVPSWHVTLQATMPEHQRSFYCQFGSQSFPTEQLKAAEKDLTEFVHILEGEGVIVRRPEVLNYAKPYGTLDWSGVTGLYAAMPRDVLIVIGNEIIEAPMAWRSRYFEAHAYRALVKEYFQAGARWAAAPKPRLSEELYCYEYEDNCGQSTIDNRYVITEFEPTFDAADFIRCGKDIFVQRSHVTNEFGIQWLQRHLGTTYNIHILKFDDPHPMHIDATLMPLAPGKLLLNPQRVKKPPEMFRNWDVLYAPPPSIPDTHPLYMTSKWVNMNVLMLDEERVIVEKNDEQLIRCLKDWQMKPIPCSFRHFNTLGGSFHCATLDVRRRGTLQSYF
jgi:glycine amidinotransferase